MYSNAVYVVQDKSDKTAKDDDAEMTDDYSEEKSQDGVKAKGTCVLLALLVN